MNNNNINKEVNLNDFDLEGFAHISHQAEESERSRVLSPEVMNASAAPDDTYDEVTAVARELVSRGIDITTPYDNWIHLGFALANGLGERGRELFHQLSAMNAEYEQKECDKKYSSLLRGGREGITIGTFFKMAQDAGINLSELARQRVRSEHLQELNDRPLCATYAITPSGTNIENIEKTSIYGTFGTEMPHGALAQVAQTYTTGYTFSDKMEKDEWSGILRNIYTIHHDAVSRDKMILGVLNVVSGLMGGANGSVEEQSGIYGIYDGRRVYAPLFTLMYGSAATKKGELIFCKLLARPEKMEMRREYEAAKAQYDEELAAYEAQGKGKGRGERGPVPKEPAFRDPFMPGNSSTSAVYRALDANGGWGIMFETEADTVSNMMSSDYGDYSDCLRKVYHHETISMNRVSEKLHIDIESPRLSAFITCTPGQVPRLFPSFENGLGSRFQFNELPDDKVEFHDVFAHSDDPLEDAYKQMGDELLPLYHALSQRKGNPIQFVLSASQKKEFLSNFGEMLKEQFQMLGSGISAFVLRMALANFRYAMVLTALRRLSDWNKKDDLFPADERALVCDDRDFHAAMCITECLINHTARVYAVLAKENENPFANMGVNIKPNELDIYRSLPDGEFGTADFLALAEAKKVPNRTATRMLAQMCDNYRIIAKVKRGVYRKAAPRED